MPLLDVPTSPHIPTGAMIDCEVCGKTVPREDARSMCVTYSTPGAAYAGQQCPAWQHWGCTHEHAVVALIACVFEHIEVLTDYQGKGKVYGEAWVPQIKALLEGYEVKHGGEGV